MSQFKVGDEVILLQGRGGAYGFGPLDPKDPDNFGVVKFIEQGGRYIIKLPRQRDYSVTAKEAIVCLTLHSKQQYPNTPHRHARFIKAWADGADIEVAEQIDGISKWVPVPKYPEWRGEQYRIKPEKTAVEIECEAILAEINKLNERLIELAHANQ